MIEKSSTLRLGAFMLGTLLTRAVLAAPTADDVLASNSIRELATSSVGDVSIKPEEAPALAQVLWAKFRVEQADDAVRRQELQTQRMQFAGKTMRYDIKRLGTRPAKGFPLYIALHGGGSGPPGLNDSQWEQMKVYYASSVHDGIYVAPRGVSDTWDLHSQAESYVLYERLIENMVALEDVDSDRVYVLGYSAGGDGVYQIAPRLSDRLAAADMSAGHPNGVNLRNTFGVPLLLQVGERDGAYGRNRITVAYDAKLEALRQAFPGAYTHETFVHVGRPHNFYDNDPRESPYPVFANPQKWLSAGDRTTVQRNTNAIAWLKGYTRNPWPSRVVWDLTTRADRRGNGVWPMPGHGQQHYWLDIGEHTAQTLGTDEIIASVDTVHNTVVVEKAKTYLKILLSGNMLDLSKTVHIRVGGQQLDVQARPTLQQQARTLLDRGDPQYIFEAQVVLIEAQGQWTIAQAP